MGVASGTTSHRPELKLTNSEAGERHIAGHSSLCVRFDYVWFDYVCNDTDTNLSLEISADSSL